MNTIRSSRKKTVIIYMVNFDSRSFRTFIIFCQSLFFVFESWHLYFLVVTLFILYKVFIYRFLLFLFREGFYLKNSCNFEILILSWKSQTSRNIKRLFHSVVITQETVSNLLAKCCSR